jgi:hypothetical protein
MHWIKQSSLEKKHLVVFFLVATKNKVQVFRLGVIAHRPLLIAFQGTRVAKVILLPSRNLRAGFHVAKPKAQPNPCSPQRCCHRLRIAIEGERNGGSSLSSLTGRIQSYANQGVDDCYWPGGNKLMDCSSSTSRSKL